MCSWLIFVLPGLSSYVTAWIFLISEKWLFKNLEFKWSHHLKGLFVTSSILLRFQTYAFQELTRRGLSRVGIRQDLIDRLLDSINGKISDEPSVSSEPAPDNSRDQSSSQESVQTPTVSKCCYVCLWEWCKFCLSSSSFLRLKMFYSEVTSYRLHRMKLLLAPRQKGEAREV